MKFFNKLYAESWNIAFRYAPKGTILSDNETEFVVIKNPVRYWAADPFVYEWKGKTYIFAELFDYCKNRGVIGCAELLDGKLAKWDVIIEEKWHLSYPFIFSDTGRYYIVPESNDSEELYYYEAIDFPHKWEKKTSILKGIRLMDTTLYQLQKQYIAIAQDHNQHTMAFSVNLDLSFDKRIPFSGPDGNVTRPGGAIFEHQNSRVCVCQDCRRTYGGALIFNEVDISDTEVKIGRQFKHLSSDQIVLNTKMDVKGIHTYNATDKVEVIDLKTKRFSVLNLIGRVIQHLFVK